MHIVMQKLFKDLPCMRSLSAKTKREAEKLLKMKANKKMYNKILRLIQGRCLNICIWLSMYHLYRICRTLNPGIHMP